MPGRVHLVGAGPGDPGLMTLRAVELLGRADAVLHDRLIPDGALDHAPETAELVYVGKEHDGPSMSQDDINADLVRRAQAGQEVVRLKGGDPFVFGRGGEEALALAAAGVAFDVVPGVTAAIAAPAYAGIPITQRELASGVAFFTGHEDPGKPVSGLDWPGIASFPGTLVFYMGVRRLPLIAERLVAEGRDPDEPAALIERGTFADQRTIVGTLGTIAGLAESEAVRPPALTLVGPVTRLREQLAWFERRPLFGRSVTVTRAEAGASGLADRLRELGAAVRLLPAIVTTPLAVAVPDLGGYDLLCLTSPNGVEALFAALAAEGRDARALAGPRVAAIGPGTAAALRAHGIDPDVVPERSLAEGLVDALADVPVKRVLIARAREGREVLPDALRARGAQVDVLALYETAPATLDAEALAEALDCDWVTFASASAARALQAAGGGLTGGRARVVSIGPVTSAALRELGREPDVEAAGHDLDGLVDALLADAAR